jgi:phage-related protein
MPVTLPPCPRFQAFFYRTEADNEPVKDAFLSLAKEDRRIVGKDLEKVKLGGPEIGKPTVGHLADGLYEIRSTIVAGKVEFRTLFRVVGNVLVLLHAFRKSTRKTPQHEIDVANERWRKAKGKQP